MWTVWAKGGKPVSLKMWVWQRSLWLLVQTSIHLEWTNYSHLTKSGLFCFSKGGRFQVLSGRTAVCPCCPVREKNGLCCCRKPQQSEGDGHPAAGQVRRERPGSAFRPQTTGMQEKCRMCFNPPAAAGGTWSHLVWCDWIFCLTRPCSRRRY